MGPPIMKTGNGKIANLPDEIREDLNYRMNDGESGNELVEWLNAKPEVVEVINKLFDGRPISEQNLSQWRTNGYRVWHVHRTIVDGTLALSDNTGEIAETGIDCDKLLLTLTAAYAEAIQSWIITPGEQMLYKLAVYKNLTNGVIALRRAELVKVRLEIERERLELLREKRRNKSDEAIGRGAEPIGGGAGGMSRQEASRSSDGPGKSRAFQEICPSSAPASSAESVSATGDERPKATESPRSGIPAAPLSNEKDGTAKTRTANAGAAARSPAAASTAAHSAPSLPSSQDAPGAQPAVISPNPPVPAPPAPLKSEAPQVVPFWPNRRPGGPPRNATPRNPLGLL
jgi:hypothetical protein